MLVQNLIESAAMSLIRRTIIVLLGIVAGIFLLVILRITGQLAYNLLTKNVHTVISGQIYRTAQLDHAQLNHYTEQFHLKTIINLRGTWYQNHWFQVESQFAASHHLHYYSISLSAYHLPTKALLRDVVNVLRTAPQPLAFHCEGGADRTGMAAAISVILFDKHATIAQIKRQVSWHYNAISGYTVGYQMLRNYFAWLKDHHDRTSSKARFLAWLNTDVPMKPYHGWFVVT